MSIKVNNDLVRTIKVDNNVVKYVKIDGDDRAIHADYFYASIISNNTIEEFEVYCTSTTTYDVNAGDLVASSNTGSYYNLTVYEGCSYRVDIETNGAYQELDSITFTVNGSAPYITLPKATLKEVKSPTLSSYVYVNLNNATSTSCDMTIHNPNQFDIVIDIGGNKTIPAISNITYRSSNFSISSQGCQFKESGLYYGTFSDGSKTDTKSFSLSTPYVILTVPNVDATLKDEFSPVSKGIGGGIVYNTDTYEGVSYNNRIKEVNYNLKRKVTTVVFDKFTKTYIDLSITNTTPFIQTYFIDGYLRYSAQNSGNNLSNLLDSSERQITVKGNSTNTLSMYVNLGNDDYNVALESLKVSTQTNNLLTGEYNGVPSNDLQLNAIYDLNGTIQAEGISKGMCFRGKCNVIDPYIITDTHEVVNSLTVISNNKNCCLNPGQICSSVLECPLSFEITLKGSITKNVSSNVKLT